MQRSARLRLPPTVPHRRRSLPRTGSNSRFTPHHFCQTHYLHNLADPLASTDSALTVTLCQAVWQELGSLLRADQPPDPAVPGVLTVTGLLRDSSAQAV